MVSAFQVAVCGLLPFLASAANLTSTDSVPANSMPADSVNAEGSYELKGRSCDPLKNYDWNGVKYACSWWHYDHGTYYNLFLKRYDGSVYYDCHCWKDLVGTYGSWGPAWTRGAAGDAYCFSRDGKTPAQAKAELDSAPNCPSPTIIYHPPSGPIHW
ncbi:hypothetical protein FI667_g10970, partial [Globisporangium splendens]